MGSSLPAQGVARPGTDHARVESLPGRRCLPSACEKQAATDTVGVEKPKRGGAEEGDDLVCSFLKRVAEE